MLEKGLTYTSTVKADEANSAKAAGSGNQDVFATPSMIALMENAAMNAVAAELPEGSATVGTKLDVAHSKATPLGDTITATATLEEVDGRRLVFRVSASDSTGLIGEGTHERFIVDVEKFMGRLVQR